MTTVIFVKPDRTTQEVTVNNGTTIMQAALDNGVKEIIAECGGACACATCHCYIDEAWHDKLPAASANEQDLLECAFAPNKNSRLGCQIIIDENLDGLIIHLPESQA